MKGSKDNLYSEKHIFIAMYSNYKYMDNMSSKIDYYLNVDNFTVKNKNLVFIHAMAGKNKDSFSSQDVLDDRISEIHE